MGYIWVLVLLEGACGFDICASFFRHKDISYQNYRIPPVSRDPVEIEENNSLEEIDTSSEADTKDTRYIYDTKKNSRLSILEGYAIQGSIDEGLDVKDSKPEKIPLETYRKYREEIIDKIQGNLAQGKSKRLIVHKQRLKYFWRTQQVQYFNSSHANFFCDTSIFYKKGVEEIKHSEKQKQNYIRIIVNENRFAKTNNDADKHRKKIDDIILEYFSVLFFNSAEHQSIEEVNEILLIKESTYQESTPNKQTADNIDSFNGSSNYLSANYTEYVLYYDATYDLELADTYTAERFINHLSEMKCFCEYIEMTVNNFIINEYSSYSKYSYRRNDTIDEGSLVEVLLYLATILPKKITVNYKKELFENNSKISSVRLEKKAQLWAEYMTTLMEYSFDTIEVKGFREGSVIEWIGFVQSLGIPKIEKFSIKGLSIISSDFIACISEDIMIKEIEIEDCDISSQTEDLKNKIKNADIKKNTRAFADKRVEVGSTPHKLSLKYSAKNALLCNDQIVSFFISLVQRVEEATDVLPDVLLCNNTIGKIGDILHKGHESQFNCNNLMLYFRYNVKEETISSYKKKIVYYLLNSRPLKPKTHNIRLIVDKMPTQNKNVEVAEKTMASKEIDSFILELMFYLPMIFNLSGKIDIHTELFEDINQNIFSNVKFNQNLDIEMYIKMIEIFQKYLEELFKSSRKSADEEKRKSRNISAFADYKTFIQDGKGEIATSKILEEIKTLKDEMVAAVMPFFIFHKKNNNRKFNDISQIDAYVCEVIKTRWQIKESRKSKAESSHRVWAVYVNSLIEKYMEYFTEIQAFILALRSRMKQSPEIFKDTENFSLSDYIEKEKITKITIKIPDLIDSYKLLKSSIEIDTIRAPIKKLVEVTRINQNSAVIKKSDATFLQLSKTNKFLYSSIEIVVNSIRLPGFDDEPQDSPAIQN